MSNRNPMHIRYSICVVRSHVHKSSWYMCGLNAYDRQSCNGFIGYVPECSFM
jgi:hypothetical protein